MANSQVAMTEGSGKNAATYSISEGTTKEIQRMALNTNAGVEIMTTAAPGNVQLRASTGQALSDTSGVLISTTQLATLQTASAAMSAGYQLVALPSDQVKIPVQGNTAHDSADADKPLKGGHKATTSLAGLTLVANADVTDGFAGIDGVQITRPHCNLEDVVVGVPTTNTDGTSTQCIAAQAAGIKTHLISIVLSNTGTNAITVAIKDGTTAKTELPLPAGSGVIYNPPIPIPGTAATAWNFDASAAITGGTLTCSMLGFKSKV